MGAVEKRLAAARIDRCAVLTCGPSGLVDDTKAACADTGGAVAVMEQFQRGVRRGGHLGSAGFYGTQDHMALQPPRYGEYCVDLVSGWQPRRMCETLCFAESPPRPLGETSRFTEAPSRASAKRYVSPRRRRSDRTTHLAAGTVG